MSSNTYNQKLSNDLSSGEQRDAERFLILASQKPTLACADPIDRSRKLEFHVVNISRTGMLLEISSDERHLFPGMELKKATFNIPNLASVIVNLCIENVREEIGKIIDGPTLKVGVSVKGENVQYTQSIAHIMFNQRTNHSTVTDDLHVHGVKNMIAPEMTRQHLHASVLLPYLLVSDQIIGCEKTDEILMNQNFSRRYFTSPTNWISIEFFDYFIEAFANVGDVFELQRQAGYKNLSKEVLGVNHFLLKHFLSPQDAFKAFGTYLPKFNKTRTCEVISSGANFCRIRLGIIDPTLKPKHLSTKANWEAIFDAHILVITGKHGTVKTIRSIFDGDPYCEFHITWDIAFHGNRHFVKLVFLMATFIYGFHLFGPKSGLSLEMLGVIVFAFGIFVFFKYIQARKKYFTVVNSLTTFQKDADLRYEELQCAKVLVEKNYYESQLLENLNRNIQSSEDLTQMLEATLNSLASNFQLCRSVVMLFDQSQNALRASAIKGFSGRFSFLRRFSVPINQVNDPFMIGALYRSGQSILMTDVRDHEFHLNNVTKKIIRRLAVRGLIVAPIPSENGYWGLILADKSDSAHHVNRFDLLTLQRVCQALGAILDKKGKFDAEQKTRKLFEKYVPSNVVQAALGLEEIRLGGEKKEALCLFMDIRNFTHFSSNLPPGILCDLLNQVFEVFTSIIHAKSGFVDKFLGDGALVTWGVVPGSPLDSKLAIEAAVDFCHSIELFNKKIVTQGFSPLNVGIGIHRGDVIAGNIGSNQRMEFTIIGNTVNIASRLEQLNKTHSSNIVISASVVRLEDLGPSWSVVKEISLRGSSVPMDIGVFVSEGLHGRTSRLIA